jgi:hypothetical protein
MLLWKFSKIVCYSENLQKYYVTLKIFKNIMLLWKSSKIVCYSENLPCYVNNFRYEGPSWSWSNGSWIYNYLCNQCLSPQMLWVRISIRTRCTTLCDKVSQRLVTGRWFSPGPRVSSTNKTDRHDITKILLKVEILFVIKQTNKQAKYQIWGICLICLHSATATVCYSENL